VTTALAGLPLLAKGKVREMYGLNGKIGPNGGNDPQGTSSIGETPAASSPGGRLLMVASDRISTYDVVHPTEIPDKGKVLTGLSAFWFEKTKHIVANHFLSATEGVPVEARGRGMVVRRLEMLPVECVVRGYITGSGWKDYQQSGRVSGIELPKGLRESERLPEPIFTPSTKAEIGHDEAIDFERAAALVGDRALMERVAEVSLELYSFAAEHALARGVILADTKFEFGLAGQELVIGDEVLTPDSSRYWPAEGYEAGKGQPSFDKQYVRDWASASGWDRRPPAPALPRDVVAGTRARYVEAYERIVGEPFERWLGRVEAVADDAAADGAAGGATARHTPAAGAGASA
jgi:phosphoribosylaminoimidazole-succinocarboxamide synthase